MSPERCAVKARSMIVANACRSANDGSEVSRPQHSLWRMPLPQRQGSMRPADVRSGDFIALDRVCMPSRAWLIEARTGQGVTGGAHRCRPAATARGALAVTAGACPSAVRGTLENGQLSSISWSIQGRAAGVNPGMSGRGNCRVLGAPHRAATTISSLEAHRALRTTGRRTVRTV